MDKLRSVAFLGAILALGTACSRADDLCALVCDCEHCNDYEEDAVCAEYQLGLDAAKNYECDSAWEAWADCFETQGNCVESRAEYTTLDGNNQDRCEGPSEVLTNCMRAASEVNIEPIPGGGEQG